jgi:hypothetical protein
LPEEQIARGYVVVTRDRREVLAQVDRQAREEGEGFKQP